ncbi:MAG: sensor histidine kinase [Thermotaleaceae bacterium]
MYKPSLDIKILNDIIRNTIESLEKGKIEIFDIAEGARNECKRVEDDLKAIKSAAVRMIDEVDTLAAMEKKSRQKLVLVSKDFKQFSEQDIKAAYEEAKELQIKITLKRQEEKELIKQRIDLERRFKNALEVVKKAERLVSQVGVAMGYLSGNLKDVFEQLEDIQQKQDIGIKIIKAQEDERQRIARDIHDGPAQSMANLVIKTEICEKLIDRDIEQTKFELSQLKNFVRESLKDIRKIIYDLRPMSLDDLGWIPTIQRFIINFEEENRITVNFSVNAKNYAADSVIQLSVFRIVQEALNNIKKHAQATMIMIKLEILNKSINMLIIDDGKGFDVEMALKNSKEDSGYGLFIMRERVELLKGEISIQSDLGKGTRIKLIIPIGDEEETYDKK